MELHTSGNEKPSSGTENRVDEKKTKSDFVKGKEHSTRTHLSIGYPFISGSNRVIMANDAVYILGGDPRDKEGKVATGATGNATFRILDFGDLGIISFHAKCSRILKPRFMTKTQ